MSPIQFVFLAFLIVPFVEIYLLLQLGGIVGILPTIGLVVLTAIIGSVLLRRQGLATWMRFQESLNRGQVPAYEMIEGPILLVGGALLLTPGFFTDILGFACLIPAIRRKIADYIIEQRILKSEAESAQAEALEGEFHREE